MYSYLSLPFLTDMVSVTSVGGVDSPFSLVLRGRIAKMKRMFDSVSRSDAELDLRSGNVASGVYKETMRN